MPSHASQLQSGAPPVSHRQDIPMYNDGVERRAGHVNYAAAYTPTYPQPQYSHQSPYNSHNELSVSQASAHGTPTYPQTQSQEGVPDILSQLISAGLIPAGKHGSHSGVGKSEQKAQPVVPPLVFNITRSKVHPFSPSTSSDPASFTRNLIHRFVLLMPLKALYEAAVLVRCVSLKALSSLSGIYWLWEGSQEWSRCSKSRMLTRHRHSLACIWAL